MLRFLRFLSAVFALSVLESAFFIPSVRADFQLLDVVKEFGEKRYVETGPTRMKVGPVNFHPTLRTKVQHDDNIFLEDKDGKQDVIYEVLPGAILDIPVSKHRVTVGYEADMEFFSKQRHRTQNDQNQNFFALFNFHFPSWYINVLERFSETSGRAGTTFTSRIPRIDQSIHPKIGYRWKRLTFEAGYRNTVRDFRRQVDDSLDFSVNEWTGIIFYDLFANLKALLEYEYAQIDYDDSPSRKGDFNQVRVGLEGEVLPNLVLKVRVGPHFRNYRFSSEQDYNSWVGEFRAEYQVRENWKVHLELTRKAVEATFQTVNFYKQHLIQTGVEYRIRPQWELFSVGRAYRQSYGERATLGERSGYRRDLNMSVRTGIRYEPRDWLEFEVAYEHFRRFSNFDTFDYGDNRFSLSSAIVY